MRYKPGLLAVWLLLAALRLSAQTATDEWSLQRCVQYAIEHNIAIRQDSLTARLSQFTLKQSQLSQLPSLTTSTNFGRSFGRSINPATNQFVDAAYDFVSASGNSSVLLFGWMQVRNTIERNKNTMKAALADLDQRKNDVALNVANGFLAALLAGEQVRISNHQVDLSKAQLDQTRAFAESGRLPELNVAQLESQLATDSANLINAIANYNSALLDLKTLLNLDFNAPFSIKIPEAEPGELLTVYTTPAEEIYQRARKTFGAVKSSELKVHAAEHGVDAARAGLYPQLSMSYQMGTTFASNYQNVNGYAVDTQYNGSFVDVSNSRYYIRQLSAVPNIVNTPFGNQLRNNFRQSVSLNLSIPIFNGWQSQYAVRQARINLAQQQLNQYNTELTLRQNVYKAHNNAVNSIQKYHAARRADEAAKRALEFARKRYDLGLTSTVDLLVTQNSSFAASANFVSAKYDLIFKLKVLDYYMGKELKL